MKKLSSETKLTIQVIISIGLIIAGVTLLFLGFYMQPPGEIHDSVLIAYGEVSTFAGSLLGIDYHYKYKTHVDDNRYRHRHLEKEIDEEEINDDLTR